MPDKIPPYSPDEWNALAEHYGDAALVNVVDQFTKHGLLGLSDHGTALIRAILCSVARQAMSATAALSIEGMNVRSAILPHMISNPTINKPDEPPSPL